MARIVGDKLSNKFFNPFDPVAFICLPQELYNHRQSTQSLLNPSKSFFEVHHKQDGQ